MPFANNGTVKIHYEVMGAGEPLIYLHGITSNLTSGYEIAEVLQDKFQVIMVDARGHGESDKLTSTQDYHFPKMVNDMCAVLDAMQVEAAHYIGYSMGGFVGAAMCKYAPHRLKSLMMGGATPYGLNVSVIEAMVGLRGSIEIGASQGAQAYVDNFIENFGPIHEGYKGRLLSTTKTAFEAQANAITAFNEQDSDFSAEFSALDKPKAMYIGENDEFFASLIGKVTQDFPETTVKAIPNMSHSDGGNANYLHEEMRAILLANLESAA